MNTDKNQSYTGIDCFRLIAALLIITIHTSPLLTYSETGDYILTRVLARLAVPFFFTTTGFFLISEYAKDAAKLFGFVKKTAFLYGLAIFIYLPLNIYNHYFDMPKVLPNILKDIVFDGTFYHLWYLPASILGVLVSWYLVRKFRFKRAFVIAVFLYAVGLFGDSYYGIAERIPVLREAYALIFEVTDYTRNGLFFAPVFLILGGMLADIGCALSLEKSICGFVVSLALMTAEALTLRYLHLQRHDSMYVFLLPSVCFLFQILLHFRGRRIEKIRTASLVIYIIHPMMIIVLRLFAKLFHLQEFFIENSLIHFAGVSFLSALCGMGVILSAGIYRNRNPKLAADTGRTCIGRAYIEIDLKNLEHNAAVLKSTMPKNCELMAVVKANAYGHGDYEVSVCLNRIGIRAFAVATIDEGIRLRRYGIIGEILILGYTDVCRVRELKKYDLTQTLIDFEYAKALNEQRTFVKTHIKIDTGMHRLGIDCRDTSDILQVFFMRYLKVYGMFTHLCCADSREPEDISFTRRQIGDFYDVITALKKEGVPMPKIHIQSSYGLLNYPELACDYVRAGIILYGVHSSPDTDTVLKTELRPVLSLKSRIILIRNVKKGDSVGYGRNFIANRDSRIAVVPVGYADGLPRILSEKQAFVRINGEYAPIVGKICMDQMMVDITDLNDVGTGDEVILIGGSKDGITAADMVAEQADSISNELLCRLGARLDKNSCGGGRMK